jgi:F-type H+-transporting ATPase subunit c
MMKTKLLIMTLLVLVLFTSAYFAQDAHSAQTDPTNTENVAKQPAEQKVPNATPLFLWSIIIGGAAITVAASFGAFAQSKALRTASENIGRNPAAADSIRGILIIGLALIESLVIYVLLIDLILFFMKWGKYTF